MGKLTFDHIGIACENIEEMITYMNKFFEVKDCSAQIFDALQNATLCMLTLADGTRIELVSGEIVKQLVKKRNYLYHTCYTVEDIDETIKELEAEGSFLISEPQPAILFDGKRVAFLTSNLGILELLEQ